MVEKINECRGAFSVPCSFRNVNDNFECAFVGVYGSNVVNVKRVCFGINWLGGLVGVIYYGVLGVISISLATRVRDQGTSILPHPRWSSLNSFLNTVL